MNELRVDIGGSVRGFRQAIEESVGMSRGLQETLDEQNKRTSQNYVSFWETALAKRDAVESAEAERRIAREKATAEAIAANTTASYERGMAARAAIQSQIAGGYVPGSMAGGVERVAAAEARSKWAREGFEVAGGSAASLAGAYLFKGGQLAGKLDANGELARGVEQALAGAVKEAGHGTMIKQEMFVLVRETFRGAGLSRILASFMRLMGLIGSAIALPATLIAAGTATIAGPSYLRYRRAKAQEEASQKSLTEKTGELSEDVRSRVEGFHRIGRISDKDYGNYMRMLKRGGFENVSAVENALAPLMKQGTLGQQEKQFEMQKQLVRAQAAYRAELEGSVNEQTQLVMIMEDEKNLRDAIAEAQKSGDPAKALELQTELLRKQKEENDSRKALADAAKPKTERHQFRDVQLDSLSRAGLFTSQGAVSNPLVDVAHQGNRFLERIANGVDKLNRKQSIFDP